MCEANPFLERFRQRAATKHVELEEMNIHPLEVEWDKTIFKEQKRNNDIKTVRLLSIKCVDEEIKTSLKGNGESYIGGDDELMAPDFYEKLDINIPSDNVDIEQVWKLYEEWLIKWTPAKELLELVREPIREGKTKKGTD